VSFEGRRGSSGVSASVGLGSDLGSQIQQVSVPNRPKAGQLGATSFEELQGNLGYLKSAAQAECYRVFDKMVERASREMKRGLWPE
jgi:hypothetical protein